MYLVSLYFDSQTEKTLRKHMEKVAVKTGNAYMAEHRIPPHLTVAACENCRMARRGGRLGGNRML